MKAGQTIDALFGSKTRVKLLHLFLNNPDNAFYVREITRLIGEQINSVRRELSNMTSVGIVTSNNTDNKLYYRVNTKYEHYQPLRAIFVDKADKSPSSNVVETHSTPKWTEQITTIPGIRVAVVAGILVKNSTSHVDVLLVGDMSEKNIKSAINSLERVHGREVVYSKLSYDEFYYRLSVRDKFITTIITSRHLVLVDADNILKERPKEKANA